MGQGGPILRHSVFKRFGYVDFAQESGPHGRTNPVSGFRRSQGRAGVLSRSRAAVKLTKSELTCFEMLIALESFHGNVISRGAMPFYASRASDDCSQSGRHDGLRQSFIASEFNIQKLLVGIVTVSALHGVE